MTSIKTNKIIKIGIFSAIAFVIMLLEFPLTMIFPIFPPFLKFDFSDVIALIGGLTLGPIAGIAIQFIKNVLNFLLHTSTGGVGEIANFIVGIAYVVPVALVYKKKPNLVGIIIGMVIGTITMVIAASLANYFVLLPLYLGGVPAEEKLKMIKSIYVPFNLVKAGIVSVTGVVLYEGMKNTFKYLSAGKY